MSTVSTTPVDINANKIDRSYSSRPVLMSCVLNSRKGRSHQIFRNERLIQNKIFELNFAINALSKQQFRQITTTFRLKLIKYKITFCQITIKMLPFLTK